VGGSTRLQDATPLGAVHFHESIQEGHGRETPLPPRSLPVTVYECGNEAKTQIPCRWPQQSIITEQLTQAVKKSRYAKGLAIR
jgi:hypothetical protein